MPKVSVQLLNLGAISCALKNARHGITLKELKEAIDTFHTGGKKGEEIELNDEFHTNALTKKEQDTDL